MNTSLNWHMPAKQSPVKSSGLIRTVIICAGFGAFMGFLMMKGLGFL